MLVHEKLRRHIKSLAVSENNHRPQEKFENYYDLFKNLVNSHTIKTESPIVSITISYDSQYLVVVTKKSDREFIISMYELGCSHYSIAFEEIVGGRLDSYIKLKEIEQNSQGTLFCAPYIDDGMFRLRIFGSENRSNKGASAKELKISELLGLDNHCMPYPGFNEPFITAAFISDDLLFVNLFHNLRQTHYHFLYRISEDKIFNTQKMLINCNLNNFPAKCFYSEDEQMVYSFYR